MYNPIIVVFRSKILESNLKFDPKNLSLLPYPNRIEFTSRTLEYDPKYTILYQNLNSDHFLLDQICAELLEDFQISSEIKGGELKETIPKDNLLKNFEEIEGYEINISPKRILMHAATPHGIFNAFQTLRQILTSSKIQIQNNTRYILPELKIKDWPCLKIRGVSDDVSRGQIPTIQSAKRFIRDMSRFKNNYYALYIEDVFQCSKHPKIGKNRGAFSPEELIELDNFAKSRFVTLFPIFETLGHMDNILTIPEYRDLGEFPGAQALALSNGNIYPFLRDFIEEIIPCFNSKLFHIGFDESFDIGFGASQELIKIIGYENVLLDHFRKVYQIAKDNGSEMILAYHDVLCKFPSILKVLPKDVTIMYWNYAPKSHFPKLKKIALMGVPVIVSSSMLCWCRHFPDYRAAMKNTINLIEYAKKLGNKPNSNILGQMISTWGDFANPNYRTNNIYGTIIASAASWTIKKIDFEESIETLAHLFFGIQNLNDRRKFTQMFISLCDINQYYKKGPVTLPQQFYTYLFRHPFRNSSNKPIVKNFKQIKQISSENVSLLESIKTKINDSEYYIQYLEFSMKIAQYLGNKDHLRVKINSIFNQTFPAQNNTLLQEEINEIGDMLNDFIEQTIQIKTKYEELWLACAKRPNLDFTLKRFEFLINSFQKKIIELNEGIIFSDPMLPSQYIWTTEKFSPNRIRYFKKEFNIQGTILSGKIQVIAGNFAEIFINKQFVGEVMSRNSLSYLPYANSIKIFDITSMLQENKNNIEIEANNFLNSIGFLNILIQIETEDSQGLKLNTEIITDNTWKYNLESKTSSQDWNTVKIIGTPPALNFDLYKPNLLSDEKSFPEQFFGIAASFYYLAALNLPKNYAKFLRLFSKYVPNFFL